MTVNNPGNTQGNISQFGKPLCEEARNITIDLRFDVDPQQNVDLSDIQSKGQWQGWMTFYIDNSANGSAVTIFVPVTLQTMTVPPNSFAYMPLLVPNPPKVEFNSAGGIAVRLNIVNFFLPPVIWSPTAPPGGGGGGGISGVTVTDFSAAPPFAIPANAARKYLFISNPVANGASAFFDFGGGGAAELTLGGIYESGPAVPLAAVNITGAGTVIAYEGT